MKIEINRDTVLWMVIAILIVMVAYVVFFQGQTSSATTIGQTAGQVASSGMVGGC